MGDTGPVRPPRIPGAIIRLLARRDQSLSILGDFEEQFYETVENSGLTRARNWYWRHCFRSIPAILKESLVWKLTMFRNYFTIAFRNIKRQKSFSFINIFGLSIALMCALWIFLFIQDEVSNNRFLSKAETIYSVINTDNYYRYNSRDVPIAMGPALLEFFPEVKHSVRVRWHPLVVRFKNNLFEERCHFVDSDFFNLFSFQVIKGNRDVILNSENAVVLTRSAARKYFGDRDPIGETMLLNYGDKTKPFTVTGLAADPPANSTIQFSILVNLRGLAFFRGLKYLEGFARARRCQTYIQLPDGIPATTVENRFPSFMDRYMAEVIADRKKTGRWNPEDETIIFWLQNIRDIYFHSHSIGGEEHSNISRSIILAAIGLLVLIIACINFTNFSIGLASTRAVEIGMRKVLGADRKNLVRQFWSESVSLVFFSMLLGLFMAVLLLPIFNRLGAKRILESDILTLPNIALFALLSLLVGLVAGFYPAFVLSSLKPVKIFRGSLKFGTRTGMIRLLVFFQFTVSTFLIIATLTMAKQLRFINRMDLGFKQEGIVTIKTQEKDPERVKSIYTLFKNESAKRPYLGRVSGCLFPIGEAEGEGTLRFKGKKIYFNFSEVYYDYFDTLGMKFLAGADFPYPLPADYNPVVVNECFVKTFDLKNPIGEGESGGDSPWKIVGVVEDFFYRTLEHDVLPVMHFLYRGGPQTLIVRISGGDMRRAITGLREIWQRVQPDKPFVYALFDEELEKRYSDEKRWNAIVLFASVFALLITCLGLIGITSISTNSRLKEIGIRRVMGAPFARIFSMLTWDYLLLLAASHLVTMPLAYVFMNRWLHIYAYRTGIGIGIFLLAGLVTLFVSIVSVSAIVFRAATANPVDCLRDE